MQREVVFFLSDGFPQGVPPRVDAGVDLAVEGDFGEVGIAAADVEYGDGEVDVVVEACLDRAQDGAEGGQRFELLPQQIIVGFDEGRGV